MRVAVAAALMVSLGAGCSSSATPAPQPSPSPVPLTGIFVYAPPETAGKITLQVWSPPAEEPIAAAVLGSGDVLASTTVSPDGKRIAYVHRDASGATALTVAALDGSAATVLLSGAEPYCDEPNWTGDGARVTAMANPKDGFAGTVAVAGGPFTPFPTPVTGCHLVWSGDGTTMAYAVSTGTGPAADGIILAHADGSGGREVPRLGADGGATKRRSHNPMSLSADGKLLALFVLQGDDPAGDIGEGGRGLVVNEIVNTGTGATVALPVTGGCSRRTSCPRAAWWCGQR
jgi:TolB protein